MAPFIGQYYLSAKKEDTLPRGHPIVEYIHHVVHKRNLNFLTLVVGPVGSGKSWACLKFAELLDPSFSEDRIVFDPRRFAEMVAHPEKYALKKGSVIIFEEAGVNMNAREFQSVKNKLVSSIAQTFRHQNLIVFFNSPNQKFVDINVRRLTHATLDMNRHDDNYGYGRFSFNVPDNITGEIYHRPMLYKNQSTGQTVKMSRIKIGRPTTDLCDAYEIRARAFKLGVAGDAQNKMLLDNEGSYLDTNTFKGIPIPNHANIVNDSTSMALKNLVDKTNGRVRM
jgi:hypothetical protein